MHIIQEFLVSKKEYNYEVEKKSEMCGMPLYLTPFIDAYI